MRFARLSSLGGRLSIWLALQSLAGLTAVCAAVYIATLLGFETQQVSTLQEKEAQVRHILSEASIAADPDALRHALDDVLVGHRDLSLTLQRADGALLYGRPVTTATGTTSTRLRVFTADLTGAPKGVLTAELALNTLSDRILLRRIGVTLALAALIGAALVSAGGYVLVRRGLRPMRELVEQTRRLTADTLHRRFDGSAQPDELEPLVAQFNDLLARLQRAYEQSEAFNADVAHELNTPLSNLITGTELALRRIRSEQELRDLLGENLEELQRMSSIVQDMLFLSRADCGALARRTPVPSLAALVGKIAEYHETIFAERDLRLSIDGDAQGEFDQPLIERAVSNLLSNAAQYAEHGSLVRVEIAERNDRVNLQVTNQGTPIAREQLPRLFDRFYRIDDSRAGATRHHGLGLAIVAAIARMHDGSATAHSNDDQIMVTVDLG
ncbi:heavy metal sensor histidine kinase [Comamonas flocculans]|uniref:Sensor protein n=1 Tax=Comamonas flocculans TaxID=2597701 RepID=A0A5B8RVM2_9BURK|nr:heavy metal sensor histidine kinase [Comamonas flocculans]